MSERSSLLSDAPAEMNTTSQEANANMGTFTAINVKAEAETTPESDATHAESSAPNTPGSGKRSAVDGAEGESPVKKTKGKPSPKHPATPARQRKAPGKTPNSGRAIATTMEELSVEDRLLLSMKDQGKSWKEIGEAWQAATGVKPAKSTLPNRYARLRANITSMSETDQHNLARAKAAIEEEFEQSKWDRIAKKMQEYGSTEKYTTSTLQKQLLKMQVSPVAQDLDEEGSLDEVEE